MIEVLCKKYKTIISLKVILALVYLFYYYFLYVLRSKGNRAAMLAVSENVSNARQDAKQTDPPSNNHTEYFIKYENNNTVNLHEKVKRGKSLVEVNKLEKIWSPKVHRLPCKKLNISSPSLNTKSTATNLTKIEQSKSNNGAKGARVFNKALPTKYIPVKTLGVADRPEKMVSPKVARVMPNKMNISSPILNTSTAANHNKIDKGKSCDDEEAHGYNKAIPADYLLVETDRSDKICSPKVGHEVDNKMNFSSPSLNATSSASNQNKIEQTISYDDDAHIYDKALPADFLKKKKKHQVKENKGTRYDEALPANLIQIGGIESVSVSKEHLLDHDHSARKHHVKRNVYEEALPADFLKQQKKKKSNMLTM
jgi:CRISPR/Cas system CMR subunit Cmr4 (Cas7 group RAMP superfamily)